MDTYRGREKPADALKKHTTPASIRRPSMAAGAEAKQASGTGDTPTMSRSRNKAQNPGTIQPCLVNDEVRGGAPALQRLATRRRPHQGLCGAGRRPGTAGPCMIRSDFSIRPATPAYDLARSASDPFPAKRASEGHKPPALPRLPSARPMPAKLLMVVPPR